MNRILCVALVVVLALQGCRTTAPPAAEGRSAHSSGAVSYSLVPASGDSQLKLRRSEHAFGAQPVAHDPPVYPAELIGRMLPLVTIRAKAIIDETGSVTEVRDLDDSQTPEHKAFFKACQQTMTHWTYTPMTVVEEFDDGRGNISQVRKDSPFSLDYAFRFELVDGKPTVTAHQ